jgi:hypothetical protein
MAMVDIGAEADMVGREEEIEVATDKAHRAKVDMARAGRDTGKVRMGTVVRMATAEEGEDEAGTGEDTPKEPDNSHDKNRIRKAANED